MTAPDTASAGPATAAPTPRRLGRRDPGTGNGDGRADFASRYGLIVALVACIVVFSILRPDTFFTTENLQTTLGSQAILLILTLALLLPFTAGEFDLSVAGVMGIANIMVGWLTVEHGWPLAAALVAAVAAGAAIGLVNAALVVGVGVDSIIVTLGSGTLLLGAGMGINPEIVPNISTTLVDAARTEFLGVQLIFFYGLALTIVLWYVFSHTPLGRYLYFVGAGRDVARLAGLRVNRLRVGALVGCSTLAAVAGVLLAGSLGGSDPNVAPGYLLPAFAGAFLGSTAIHPGRFNPWGAFIAVYFLVTGITGLQLMGLSGWIEQVFYGGSLVLAVTLSRLAARRRAS
jgi:ribose transport system permease protein